MKKILYKILKKIKQITELIVKTPFIIVFKKKMLKRIIKNNDYFNLPFYIISYNRLGYIKQTIDWLKEKGYHNITIIDNNSDYEPLLKYYNKCGCKVIRLKNNYGHEVFYKCFKFLVERNKSLFFLTDPNLKPINECPNNFAEIFVKFMYKHPFYPKVGFSLKIDDIPDNYYLKKEVIMWEQHFYNKVIDKINGVCLYKAEIDTTLSLNSPNFMMTHSRLNAGIRVGYPYQLRHLPWYTIENDKENEYYLKTKRKDITNWNGDMSKEEIQKMVNDGLK